MLEFTSSQSLIAYEVIKTFYQEKIDVTIHEVLLKIMFAKVNYAIINFHFPFGKFLINLRNYTCVS